jgi:hypothetical protein
MLAKKILKNLENGNYRIKYREKCDCGFYWYVNENNEFVCECVKNGVCYYDNLLIMDDLAGESDDVTIVDCDGVIAVYDNYYGVSLQILCKNDAIVKQIQQYIWDDAEIWRDFIASINYPSKHNELHERRRDKAFVEFLGIRKEMIL